jgi:hypothetical protein
MHTLGIDLSAQPKATAACLLGWGDSSCRVARFAVGLDNDALLDLIETTSPTKVAIDAPFGWPVPFVEAVSGYAASGHGRRQQRHVGRSYCERRISPSSRLRVVGLDATRYKGSKPEQQQKRRQLTETIAEATSTWLELNAEERGLVAASDHLLDALVSAVVARAAAIGLTLPIPDDAQVVAATEGWIHLPRRQPLVDFQPFVGRWGTGADSPHSRGSQVAAPVAASSISAQLMPCRSNASSLSRVIRSRD